MSQETRIFGLAGPACLPELVELDTYWTSNSLQFEFKGCATSSNLKAVKSEGPQLN